VHRKSIDSKLPQWLSKEYGDTISPQGKETLGYTMSNFISNPIFKGELLKHLWNNDNVESGVRTLNEEIRSLMTRTLRTLVDELSISTSFPPRLKELVVEQWDRMLEDAHTSLDEHNKLLFDAEKQQTFTINHYYEMTMKQVRAKIREYKVYL
jgi:hypothetical protein